MSETDNWRQYGPDPLNEVISTPRAPDETRTMAAEAATIEVNAGAADIARHWDLTPDHVIEITINGQVCVLSATKDERHNRVEVRLVGPSDAIKAAFRLGKV